jgi:HSP20 family molecular chaperone IbpA
VSGFDTELRLARLQVEIRESLQRLLDNLAPGVGVVGGLAPADVVETRSELIIAVEVPGIEAADLEVRAAGATVEIEGRKRPRPLPAGARSLCLESAGGMIRRRIELDLPVNSHRARASLRNGVLTIRVPKLEDQRSRKQSLEIEEPA